jgi:hypothetical protein
MAQAQAKQGTAVTDGSSGDKKQTKKQVQETVATAKAVFQEEEPPDWEQTAAAAATATTDFETAAEAYATTAEGVARAYDG